jgi:hypothetical protein
VLLGQQWGRQQVLPAAAAAAAKRPLHKPCCCVDCGLLLLGPWGVLLHVLQLLQQ